MYKININKLTKSIQNFIRDNDLDLKLKSVSFKIADGNTYVCVQVESDKEGLDSHVAVEGFSIDDIEEIIVDDIKDFARKLGK